MEEDVPASNQPSPSPAYATLDSPSSTRATSMTISPRDERAMRRGDVAHHLASESELSAILRKPWRGQAEKLKPSHRRILDQFEERGVRKKKLEDGIVVEYATTRYWLKWDGEATAKETLRLNITRLLSEVLSSKHCPLQIKKGLAEEMNNAAAKAWLAQNVSASRIECECLPPRCAPLSFSSPPRPPASFLSSFDCDGFSPCTKAPPPNPHPI